MANFNTDVNLSPNYGVSISHRPVQKIQRYADGYEHRLNFGVAAHQNPRTVNLQFNDITEAESDSLIAFLVARSLDNASFDFTPPGESSSSKFVCESWSKQIPYLNRATIQATFREVFQV